MATEVRYKNSTVDENEDKSVTARIEMEVQFDLTDTVASRMSPADALDLTAVPQIGAQYVYNSRTMPLVFCNKRSAKQRGVDHYHIFDVELMYKSNGIDGGGGETDPFSRPTKYWYESEYFQRVVEKDLTSPTPQVVQNTAHDPYSEPLLADDRKTVVCVQRNEADPPVVAAETYENATNSTAVTINGRTYAARILRIRSITSGEPQLYGGSITYYTVTYKLHIAREGWKVKVASKGTRSHDHGDGITPEPIRDENGQVIPSEQFLDINGLVDNEPYISEYQVYKELDLSVLGL